MVAGTVEVVAATTVDMVTTVVMAIMVTDIMGDTGVTVVITGTAITVVVAMAIRTSVLGSDSVTRIMHTAGIMDIRPTVIRPTPTRQPLIPSPMRPLLLP